jgi:sugar transferase (PEP-CTERM/EpsH1 system associated)
MPYPPNKGDKIRSFNLLKQLSTRYRVYLGTFIDDPDDARHVPALRKMCHEVRAEVISSRLRKLLSARGLLRGEALSLPYYRHRRLAAWVRHTLASNPIDRVLIFSSPMAQYVWDERYAPLRRVADFVDVDSEKWRQYSAKQHWPMTWLYRREGEKLLGFERKLAAHFDASFFVTSEEAELFRRLAPEVSERVSFIPNGVDTEFFSPSRHYDNPYPNGELVLVFTGAMDYWANIDAVAWFAREVFPMVFSQVPQARLYVVGARPTEQVHRLAQQKGIRVTGTVRDIRPYLAHAQLAVAPLRVARGVQNKVLEAMAMAIPVLATPAAMEGLQAPRDFQDLITDEPEEFAARAVKLLSGGIPRELGRKGRESVVANCSWDRMWQPLKILLNGADDWTGGLRRSA